MVGLWFGFELIEHHRQPGSPACFARRLSRRAASASAASASLSTHGGAWLASGSQAQAQAQEQAQG